MSIDINPGHEGVSIFESEVRSLLDSNPRNKEALKGKEWVYIELAELLRHDRVSFEHTLRVTEMFDVVLKDYTDELHLTEEAVLTGRRAALEHDLGKKNVPLSILTKSDRLVPKEEQLMQKHVLDSRIIAQSHGGDPEADAIFIGHHMWGREPHYPDIETYGPRGDELLRKEQVLLATVDAYDAMTGPRPYNNGGMALTIARDALIRERVFPEKAIRIAAQVQVRLLPDKAQ